MHTTDATGLAGGHANGLPQVALEITRGRAKHRRRDVRSTAFLIGSAPDNDLVLGDARFDELHSYVFLSPQKVTIRRLGEGPALCVGAVPVSTASLEDADRLQLGSFEFQVRIDWQAGAQRAERPPLAALAQPPVAIDSDPALERLLCDIERCSPESAVRLFVGESPAPTGAVKHSVPPAAAYPTSRKVSY
jgi:hypothetical protein